tara:strand:+ start:131 stop:523 length:393 start_codon:yes stop_codon:yes gene_type:complete
MASVTITFPHTINISIQPGDIMYASLMGNTFATFGQQAGTNNTGNPVVNTAPIAIGKVTSVDHFNKSVVIDDNGYTPVTISTAHYLFFSKDRRVNMSGVTGYFAEVEYRNESKLQTEIFATATDYSESSK